MAGTIQRFFANNKMELLLVTWYTLHLPLIILFISYKVGYHYFAALILISTTVYHLVKSKGNTKSLATYFVVTIIGYLFIIALILCLKHPDQIWLTKQKATWVIASKDQAARHQMR